MSFPETRPAPAVPKQFFSHCSAAASTFFYWVYTIGGELVETRRAKGLPLDSVSNSVYLMALLLSTIVVTLISSLDAFSELASEMGPKAAEPKEAILLALIAGFFILLVHTSIALVIAWFIYKRSDPSPRILYIMFSIFRLNVLTIAFLQASLNNLISLQRQAPAISLVKK